MAARLPYATPREVRAEPPAPLYVPD